MHTSPQSDDALYGKVEGQHITKMIANAARESERTHKRIIQGNWIRGIVIVWILGTILAICWLFLYYDQADLIGTVLGALVVWIGGIGLGRATTKK